MAGSPKAGSIIEVGLVVKHKVVTRFQMSEVGSFVAKSPLRENGEMSLADVRIALLEVNGSISVVRREQGDDDRGTPGTGAKVP